MSQGRLRGKVGVLDLCYFQLDWTIRVGHIPHFDTHTNRTIKYVFVWIQL